MMTETSAKPRFRDDLVAQSIEESGIQYVDVTDPNSGSTFRFYDVEYLIASAMNGDRDLDGLVEWTKAELGIDTSADELAGVVSTLADLGYLDAAAAAAGIELGAPGASGQGGEPTRESVSGIELGAPGRADANEDFVHESPTAAGGDGVELGAPGRSLTDAPTVPKIDTAGLELGPPVKDEAVPEARAIELSGSDVQMEIAAEPPPPGSADDMSFEGLMDEASKVARNKVVPTSADITPPPADMPSEASDLRPTTAKLDGMEEDTNIPRPLADGDDDDVSVDLSQHLSLDKDQVQEAVRQSQVMMVPELPPDLIEEERKAAAMDAARRAEDDAGKSMPLPPPPSTGQLNAVGTDKPRSPSRLPDRPAVPPVSAIEPTKAPKAAPLEHKESSSGPLLLVILLLIFAGGGVYWYFFMRDTGGAAKPGAASKPPVDSGKVPPPDKGKVTPPPPQPVAPTAVLEERVATAAEAKSPGEGVVAWVEARKDVVSDAPVVKLQGFQKWETQRVQAAKRLEFYNFELEKAKGTADAAAQASAEKKVAEKQGLVKQADDELVKLVAVSPGIGTLEIKVAMNAKVAAGDVVATVSGGAPQTVGKFDAGAGAAGYAAEGANCAVAAKGASDKRAACVVESVEGSTVTVRLVDGSPFKAGDSVELMPARK